MHNQLIIIMDLPYYPPNYGLCLFIMWGGRIVNNEAAGAGGGIYNDGGRLLLYGEFYSNKSGTVGGIDENMDPPEPDFEVTFDFNYLNAPVAQVIPVYSGYSLCASIPTELTQENYNFKEWNTAPDGSGDVYDVDMMVDDNITLYAQWDLIPPVDPPDIKPPPVTDPTTGANPAPLPNTGGGYKPVLQENSNNEPGALLSSENAVKEAQTEVIENLEIPQTLVKPNPAALQADDSKGTVLAVIITLALVAVMVALATMMFKLDRRSPISKRRS